MNRRDWLLIPLGVILMIFEARPNVTPEAGALCLKSGNAALLRGGSEARRTNEAMLAAFEGAIPPGAIRYYQTYYRDPSTGFCTTAGGTFNVSNGVRIVW